MFHSGECKRHAIAPRRTLTIILSPVQLSNELKRSCWDVLTKLMSEGAARELVSALQAPNSPQYWIDSSTSGKTWGIAPFFIAAREEYPVHAFDFSAPTIARNTLRVLRAMQVRSVTRLDHTCNSWGVRHSRLPVSIL